MEALRNKFLVSPKNFPVIEAAWQITVLLFFGKSAHFPNPQDTNPFKLLRIFDSRNQQKGGPFQISTHILILLHEF